MNEESRIWYISINDEKDGPFSIDEIPKKRLTKDSLVWKKGMVSWLRANDVPEFAPFFDPRQKESSQKESEESRQTPKQDDFSEKSESSLQISKLQSFIAKINVKIKENIEKIKNNWLILNRDKPLVVPCASAAAFIIIIVLTVLLVHSGAAQKRKEIEYAVQTEITQRTHKQELRRKERELRALTLWKDSAVAAEAQRVKIAEQSVGARGQQPRRAERAAAPQTFTDSRDGRTYTIKRFNNGATWFVQDLGGRRFTWAEAAGACPQGWRLPGEKEWGSLSSALGTGAQSYFGSINSWWSATQDSRGNAYIWYLSGGTLVGKSNNSDINGIRCLKN